MDRGRWDENDVGERQKINAGTIVKSRPTLMRHHLHRLKNDFTLDLMGVPSDLTRSALLTK